MFHSPFRLTPFEGMERMFNKIPRVVVFIHHAIFPSPRQEAFQYVSSQLQIRAFCWFPFTILVIPCHTQSN